MGNDPDRGPLGPARGWDESYRTAAPKDLPWNAGGADPDLVGLVEAGRVPRGRALDAGTGLGHDAVFLARRGWGVTALDVAPTAVALALEGAKAAGVPVDFRVADVLRLSEPDGAFAFVNDRGCFHSLESRERPTCVGLYRRLLAPSGLLLLRVFSDAEPPGPGPSRFTRAELEGLWSAGFVFEELSAGVFAGPRKPKAWLCVLRRKP